MYKYKVTIDPIKFTNDFPKKTIEVTCKKPNIPKIIYDLYNIDGIKKTGNIYEYKHFSAIVDIEKIKE